MNSKLMSLSDHELIALFKEGNSEAFGVVVQKYTQTLSAVLFMVLKDPMLVEDVLQDTFIRAMEAIQKGSYKEVGNLKPYLSKIGYNIAMDYFRELKKYPIIHVPQSANAHYFTPLVDAEQSPEDEIICFETDYNIQILIDELPEEQKEVIKLHHFQKLSFKQISECIGGGISINTCLGRMRYGLINLRRRIDEIKHQGQKAQSNLV